MTGDHLPHVPGVAPGHYRVGLHGGGDCVYLQLGDQPSKADPRICVAFPQFDGNGNIIQDGAQMAADIVDALNAASDAVIATDPHV